MTARYYFFFSLASTLLLFFVCRKLREWRKVFRLPRRERIIWNATLFFCFFLSIFPFSSQTIKNFDAFCIISIFSPISILPVIFFSFSYFHSFFCSPFLFLFKFISCTVSSASAVDSFMYFMIFSMPPSPSPTIPCHHHHGIISADVLFVTIMMVMAVVAVVEGTVQLVVEAQVKSVIVFKPGKILSFLSLCLAFHRSSLGDGVSSVSRVLEQIRLTASTNVRLSQCSLPSLFMSNFFFSLRAG